MLDPMVNAMRLMHDMAELRRTVGGQMSLLGNVAPVAVLMRETPERVIEESRRCIEGAAEGGGFGLLSGGVIDRGTPPENIDALVEASEKFGKY